MNMSQALSTTALSNKRPNITHPSKQTRCLNKMHTHMHINYIQHTNHSSISFAYQSPILLTSLSSLQFATHHQLCRKTAVGKVMWALREWPLVFAPTYNVRGTQISFIPPLRCALSTMPQTSRGQSALGPSRRAHSTFREGPLVFVTSACGAFAKGRRHSARCNLAAHLMGPSRKATRVCADVHRSQHTHLFHPSTFGTRARARECVYVCVCWRA